MIITERIFILLMLYSFIGWIYESTLCSITQKSLVNRGFLNGPICPIYGVGALLVVYFLNGFKDNIILLFLASIPITIVLEYLTSYVLEKLFKTKWWDYSHFRFNINGRVWLIGSIVFGLLSVLLVQFIHPIFNDLVQKLPIIYLYLLSGILFAILLFDLFITVKHLVTFNSKLLEIEEAINKYLEQSKLNTKQLKCTVIETIENSKNYLNQVPHLMYMKKRQFRRLLLAFPRMNSIQFNDTFNDIKEYLANNKEKLKIANKSKKTTKDKK